MLIYGSRASLAFNDIGYIIYEGKRDFEDGLPIDLPDCVASYMTPVHIRAARVKCGYCPATRMTLKHSLIRHEAIVGEDNEIDLEADLLGKLLAIIEQSNHDAVESLQQHGYEFASEGARTLRCVSSALQTAEAQNRFTQTEPNTREHQDQLMKCSTAGLHFRLTGDGDVLTSSDWILAHEKKAIPALVKKAKKRKQDYKDIEKRLLWYIASCIVIGAKQTFRLQYNINKALLLTRKLI